MTIARRPAWTRNAAWIGVALGVLAGCAAPKLQGETPETRAQTLHLERSVDTLRRDLTALRGELATLRKQLDTARGEVQDTIRGGEARQTEAVSTLDRRLAATEQRVEGLADALSGLEVTVAGLGDQVARLETGSLGAPNGGLDGKGGRSRSRFASVPLSAEELFDRAMESFRGGELGQSVLDFEEFVGKYPAHPLVGSAQFWIGEAYFRVREYQHAVVEYQKAIVVAPNGEKTPEALLRLGFAHRALKREDRAREVWARLLRDFPESDAAQRARTVLREVLRPGRSGVTGESK